MRHSIILVRYGELSLKSAYVRNYFESILIRNIHHALTQEQLQGSITRARGRIYVQTHDIKRCCRVLQHVVGITSLSPSVETPAHPDDISAVALELMRESLTKHQSFAIRATRTGTHPFTSQDIAIRVGTDIVHELHAPVDLTNPDVELFIEVREKKAFLFTEKIKGVGGLPMGTQGTVLALIDTPASMLAAWFLMHRGCDIVFVCTNKSMKKLSSFQKKWYVGSRSIVVNPRAHEFYTTLNTIAADHHCDAVVMGLTLARPKATFSLLSRWKQVSAVPLLTPLIAMDEQEIRARCRKLGVPP
ncbi:MAG TPA: THUMP domain-containing protein [Candidatus Thermoplasmatota archaeon]|nr:THUMP domain-containing protein [Candidatus Thermoplasmatota archaeon]